MIKLAFEAGYAAAFEKLAATRGIKELVKGLSPEDAAAYQRLVANKEDTGKLWNAMGDRKGLRSWEPEGMKLRHKLLGVGPDRYHGYLNPPRRDEGVPHIVETLHRGRDFRSVYQRDPLNKNVEFGMPPAVADPADARDNPAKHAVPAAYRSADLYTALAANKLKHHEARVQRATDLAEAALARGEMGADPTTHPMFKDTLLGRLTSPQDTPAPPVFSSDMTKPIKERLYKNPTVMAAARKPPSLSVRQLPPDQRPPGALPPGTPPRNKNVMQLTNVVKPGLPPSQWKGVR